MSGKPNKEDVRLFSYAIERMARSQTRINVLAGEMEIRRLDLEGQKTEYEAAHREAFKLLERMDVKANGNAGYEARAAWFFAQLHRQLTGAVAGDEPTPTV